MIDADAAATALGISRRTLRQWIHDGDLRNHGTHHRPRLSLLELRSVKTRRALRRSLRLDTAATTV